MENNITTEIVNIKGQVVQEQIISNQSNFELDLLKLASGVNILKIQSDENVARVKVVKEN